MSRPKIVAGQAALTAIVAAMDEEVAPLRERLVARASGSLCGRPLAFGRLGSAPVVLLVTGEGARNARGGLTSLLAQFPVSRILVAGVSGGLTPDVDVGSLVIGGRVVDVLDGSVRGADEALVEAALRACHAPRGVLVTAPRIADSAEEKERLREAATRACGGAAAPSAVDLESSIFADVAAGAGVPWVALRAISDTAGESVPALLNRSRDEGGAIRRSRVVLGLLGDPRPLGRLLVLRRRVSTCALGLARAVAQLVESLEPGDLPVTAGDGASSGRAAAVGTEV
ncbi:MAG TPA: hypothetical protein VHL80_13555 [Polyangia bacterium]|nr:hypothetical protein [Polyangia bacterium]